MAPALVGTIGAVSTGVSGAAVTPAWGTSENRTANNLLVLQVAVTGSATVPTQPSGWSTATTRAGTTCSVGIFYKVAAGADAAPTVAAITSGIINARLAEYSGMATTSVLSSTGVNSGTSSPVAATNAAADAASPALMVSAVTLLNSSARTNAAWAETYTNGTATQTNNSGTSTASHYGFSYANTTAHASADADSFAFTTTQVTGVAVALASFVAVTIVSGTGTMAGTFTATATGTLSISGTGSVTGTFAATAAGQGFNPNLSIVSRAAVDGGSPNSTPSFTPVAGSVLLVGFLGFANAAGTASIADTFGDTGGGTWAPLTGSVFTTGTTYGNQYGGWWRTIGTGASAGAVTITISGWTGGESIVIVDQATLTTGPATVLQSNVVPSNYVASGSVSLAVAPNIMSMVWSSGATGHTGQALAVTTAGFTALDLVNTGTSLSQATAYDNGSAATTVAWSGLNVGQTSDLMVAEIGPQPTTGALTASFSASGTGLVLVPGTGTLTGSFAATATATWRLPGTASISGTLTATATGLVRVPGTGALIGSFSATATGTWSLPASAGALGTFTASAIGAVIIPGNPKIATLVDNFNSGTLNPAMWAVDPPGFGFSEPVNLVGGQVDISGVDAALYGCLQSVGTYDLTGSSAFAQLVSAGDQSGTFDVYPVFLADWTFNNIVGWECTAGTLYMIVPGISSIPLAYDPDVHKWFRISESGGTLTYDYSTDGTTWTTAYTGANTVDITALQFYFIAGFQSDAGPQTEALFDNVNTSGEQVPYDVVVAADSPTHWWKLGDASGTSYADSGVGTNTPLSGFGTITLGQSGIPGSSATAAQFAAGSGSSQSTALYSALFGALTTECWFKSTVSGSGAQSGPATYSLATLVSFGGDGNGMDYQTGLVNGHVNAYATPDSFATPLTYNDGNWHHVVLTMSSAGGNNAIVYVDGAPVVTGPLAWFNFSNVWIVGGATPYSQVQFAGTIAHVAVYEGTVLTPAQVLAHYTAGNGAPPVYSSAVLANGPVFYWRLDEPTGTTAADATGTGHTGTYSSSGVTLGEPPAITEGGTSMYVTPPTGVSIPTFPAAQTYPFSIEFWVDVAYVGQWGTLFGKVTNSGWGDGFACYSTGNPTWDFWVSGYTLPGVTFSMPEATGTFTHLVATYDGTTGNVYVNGAWAASGSMAPTNLSNAASFWVGQDGNGFGLNAYFDEVAFYNYVLSPTVIATHYSIGTTAVTVTTVPGTGAATVTFTATAVGRVVFPSTGAMAGSFSATSTATWVPVALGSGSVLSTFAASATGVVVFSVPGGLTGIFAATATGTSRLPGTGTAIGTFSASGTGLVTVAATGAMVGTFTASAATTGSGAVLGAFAATSVGLVVMPSHATLAGTFAATAAGALAVSGTASGNFTASAQGIPIDPAFGTFVGTFTGLATGTMTPVDLGTAALVGSFLGQGTGVVTVSATAAMTESFLASATGTWRIPATGTAIASFTSSATGLVIVPSTATASGIFTAVATGTVPGLALGTGAIVGTFSASGTGLVRVPSTANAIGIFAANATSVIIGPFAATGALAETFTGSASGTSALPGHSSLVSTFTGSAAGTINKLGSASLVISFTAMAAGVLNELGSGIALGTFTASAVGVLDELGSGTVVSTFLATATGVMTNYPKFDTLVDNFNSGVIDTEVWEVLLGPTQWGFGVGDEVNIANGQLCLYAVDSSTYAAIQTVDFYDLTGSAVYIELVASGDQSGNLDVNPLWFWDDLGNGLGWDLTGGQLNAVLGTTLVGPTLTYDPAVHKWFRIRESEEVLYFDWSTDGEVWTTDYSIADTDAGADLAALQLAFYSGFQSGDGTAGPPTTTILDNVNTSNPKIATLIDDFSSGLDTTVWDVNDPAEGLGGDALVDVVNGQLNITVGTGGVYGGIQCYEWFDLTGSEVIVQLVNAGNQALLSSHDVWPIWVADSNALGFGWEVQNGLVWSGFPAGINGPTATYDPNVHRWFRIRELDGIFYEDYSPDRMNWTTMFSHANTFGFVPTAVQLSLQAGIPGMTEPQTTTVFDNVNTFATFSGSGRVMGTFRARAEGFVSGPTPSWEYINRSAGFNYNDVSVAVGTKVKEPVDMSFDDSL
jgi:hypothetical protein